MVTQSLRRMFFGVGAYDGLYGSAVGSAVVVVSSEGALIAIRPYDYPRSAARPLF